MAPTFFVVRNGYGKYFTDNGYSFAVFQPLDEVPPKLFLASKDAHQGLADYLDSIAKAYPNTPLLHDQYTVEGFILVRDESVL